MDLNAIFVPFASSAKTKFSNPNFEGLSVRVTVFRFAPSGDKDNSQKRTFEGLSFRTFRMSGNLPIWTSYRVKPGLRAATVLRQ